MLHTECYGKHFPAIDARLTAWIRAQSIGGGAETVAHLRQNGRIVVPLMEYAGERSIDGLTAVPGTGPSQPLPERA